MTRQWKANLSVLLIALSVATGCHPTQPFYWHGDGDLDHYLGKVTDLEMPDVNQPRLAEVDNAQSPLMLSNPEPTSIWDLSLEEAVSITLQNSRVIRNLGAVTQFGFADALIERTGSSVSVYDPAITESDPQGGVEAALSAFDAQLSMLGTNNGNFISKTDRPSTFGFGGGTPIIKQTLGGMRTELSKRTASGTQVFARNITEYTRGNTFGGLNQQINSIWQTTMELEVRQPLLQNRGTLINRIPVILARINTDVSLASFEASIRNLMLDVENTYWDLHFAYRNLETARIARDSAQTTWKTVYEKFKGGIEGAQAEQQAREQYFFFRAQLESALRDLYNAEGRLRFLMGISPTDGRLIRPMDEPTTANVEFDWGAIQEECLMRSAELRQQKWLIQRRELELIAAKNQLLPQFDLGATYRWFGLGDHLINADRNGLNFPVKGSTAYDVLTEGDFQEAAFFMQFQMPVGFRRALSGVRNSQLQLARSKAQLEDMELNILHLLSSSYRNLDANHQLAQTHVMRWGAATQEVQTAQTLFAGGKISLDLVLDAQRRRAQAQIDYYRAIIDYNKSIAEVHFRKGSLLEYDNIRLAEGPWPEKAYWDALGHARQRDASYYLDYGWSRPRVISQGPIDQEWGDYGTIDAGVGIIEEVPSGTIEPVPTQPPEKLPESAPEKLESPKSDQAKPRQPGPITSRPQEPMLNAPVRRASRSDNNNDRTAMKVQNSFEWGTLENNSIQGVNPLRQVTYEE